MSVPPIGLLDLSDEILLYILKKLNNIDVLYSLLDINNERLDILAQEQTFTNILNFADIHNTSTINRFCTDILPRIHHNIRYLIVKPMLMDRILLATIYPNLTQLKICNFDQEVALQYLTDESSLRHLFQEQITRLVLANRDEKKSICTPTLYTKNVYDRILNFFKNLRYLNIIGPYVMSYPGLSLSDLPSTTFSSSALTHLLIHVQTFNDCLYLLDGRLKQLSELNVTVDFMDNSSRYISNMDKLPNLKCFSFKSTYPSYRYNQVVSLLRRMPCLENLTLHLLVKVHNNIIDGTRIHNDILIYMPQLHSFTFYICTYINTHNLSHLLSCEDIQQSLKNIGQHTTSSFINYIATDELACSIFSLPFSFDYLIDLGNTFPDIVFSYVTYLRLQDFDAFKHDFFVRLARSFPLLKYLRIFNSESQSFNIRTLSFDNCQSYSIVTYPQLTTLDVTYSHHDYLEQFLNETKAYVPCLTELCVCYRRLKMVTEDFKRQATRRNCAKIDRLVFTEQVDNSKDYSHYFPSLKNVSVL